MDRRLIGAMVLCGALLFIVAGSGFAGQAVAGIPTAAPVRPVPSVGDCQVEIRSATDFNSLPSPALSPCTGPRAAEVMMVFPDYAAASVVTADAVRPSAQCAARMTTYLGQPDEETTVGSWDLAMKIRTELVGPDQRQRATGQHWAACVVYPAERRDGVREFSGPVRDLLLRPGVDNAAFSSCANDIAAQSVSCLLPHRVEVFATMSVVPGTTAEQLQSSCLDLVTAVTRMPDPTASGALIVAGAVPADGGAAGKGASQHALCAVTVKDSNKALTLTLRNLGSAPLPLH